MKGKWIVSMEDGGTMEFRTKLECADSLGVGERTVQDWASGGVKKLGREIGVSGIRFVPRGAE